jgi:hypothetical protein
MVTDISAQFIFDLFQFCFVFFFALLMFNAKILLKTNKIQHKKKVFRGKKNLLIQVELKNKKNKKYDVSKRLAKESW